MKVLYPLTPEQFLEKAGVWLGRDEARNNALLGTAAYLASKPALDRPEHHFWVTELDGEVLGAAAWTPPFKLAITDMPMRALTTLVLEIEKVFPDLPGVMGPPQASEFFSQAWNSLSFLEESARLYQLDRVEDVPASPGSMRLASPGDLDAVTEWYRGFLKERRTSEKVNERNLIENYIREERLFLWDDGGPKAMAGAAGFTAKGARINMVYTLPGSRKRGYATSLVAALSRRLLGSGKGFCLLYTDLSNPASHDLYRKIGYKPILDWNAYRFK